MPINVISYLYNRKLRSDSSEQFVAGAAGAAVMADFKDVGPQAVCSAIMRHHASFSLSVKIAGYQYPAAPEIYHENAAACIFFLQGIIRQ